MIRCIKPVPVACAKRHCDMAVFDLPDFCYAEPYRFRCHRCGQVWSAADMFSGFDVAKVTCSNCYSDNVSMTAIKIQKVMEAR